MVNTDKTKNILKKYPYYMKNLYIIYISDSIHYNALLTNDFSIWWFNKIDKTKKICY